MILTTFAEPLEHEMLHGGNQALARRHWSDHEWSTELIRRLHEREQILGRELRRDEIIGIMERQRFDFQIADRPIVHYRGGR
jgi:hypothetical protein